MSDLPSIDDFIEEELPSVEEFIKEENLPSIDEFIEKEEEEIVEEKKECGEGEYFCNDEQKCKPIPAGHKVLEDGELVKESQDLTEVLQLINAVRRDIPNVPEIKYYDEELKQLAAQIEVVKEGIPEIPEIRYYDDQVEAICEAINLLRGTVKDLPEVKYYDEQLDGVEDKIDLIQQEITNLPQPKYYEDDFVTLREELQVIRDQIPTFPKWVNEVNEVPDFSWIGKTFSVIDDDFVKVGDNIKDLRDRFDADFHDLSESLDTKDFEKRVQIDEVKADIKETNERIFKELKEAAIKIWSHHDMFKDDDRKLKKNVLSKLNETKQKIEAQILDSRTKSYEENKVLEKYFDGLREEIDALPEVKYYDTPIREIKKEVSKLNEKVGSKLDDTTFNIAELYKLVGEIKNGQQQLQEVATSDDQIKEATKDFVTVEDLQKNYKLFVQNVQQQMQAWGDGGEVNLQYMDDITGIATNISAYDGMYLQIDTSQAAGKKFKFSSVSAGSTIWTSDGVGISTLGSVGIGTTANSSYKLIVGSGNTADTVAYFDGNISIAGSTFSREVVELESLGIITATKGVDVISGGVDITAGGINVAAGVGTFGLINPQDVLVSNASTVTGRLVAQDVLVSNASTITGRFTAQDVLVSGGATVTGSLSVAGDLDVTGDITYDEVGGRNLNITGIATLGNLGVTSTTTTQDLAVSAGATVSGLFTAQDSLVSGSSTVSGNMNVVGILTVGSASVTIDGDTNTVAASNFTVGVGGTNIFTTLEGKTSIGLVLALS